MWVDKVCVKFLLAIVLLTGCTKPNPNRCCTDEADCTAKGIPAGSDCEAGLLCRGNQCISIPCATSGSCDEAAPYCVADTCAESCTDDGECPGFAQNDRVSFCVSGTCSECRANDDCPAGMPVCAAGTCRECAEHDECPLGICKPDGACAAESEIAFVSIGGTAGSDCTRLSPCTTLERAVALMPAREFIAVSPGTYSSAAAYTFPGTRFIVGTGDSRPVLTRSTAGPIISLSVGAQTRLEHVQISGAFGTNQDGHGIMCGDAGGAPTVTLRDVVLTNNSDFGVFGRGCVFSIAQSRFTANDIPLQLIDGNAVIDANEFTQNGGGVALDSGIFTFTNNIIARNYNATRVVRGLNIFTSTPGTRVEHNTIADNGDGTEFAELGAGINCNATGVSPVWPNNIVVRNRNQTFGSNCSFPSSILRDSDISDIRFRSPDSEPYDYHLQAGSIAIDAAAPGTVTTDIDGEARPSGAQSDVGADEYVP